MPLKTPELQEKLRGLEFDYDRIVLVLFHATHYNRCIRDSSLSKEKGKKMDREALSEFNKVFEK